ncbi:hypothetical protein LWI29_014390 [Acer saccharum]|uniref:Uncharacterized protein n=1 Tax=Acer saccharum TaxID=4024 RepID=A0AA39T7L8_ACESA|nr:hypothetical protein LWI29_014390 [Acer saccharum]
MKKLDVVVCVSILLYLTVSVESQSISSPDTPPMLALKASLGNQESLGCPIRTPVNGLTSRTIPDFLEANTFPGLKHLHLAFNNIQGPILLGFENTFLQSLWLNGQMSESKLNGSIAVLQNMTYLTEVWLHGNEFTGPMPDLSGLSNLNQLSLRDNNLMGIVPLSVVNHPKLAIVNLTNNYLQGPTPKFDTSKVAVDMNKGSNNFCLDEPGTPYDDRVNILLSILEPLGYPAIPTHAWKGNDPCPNIKRSYLEGRLEAVDIMGHGAAATEEDEARVEAVGH